MWSSLCRSTSSRFVQTCTCAVRSATTGARTMGKLAGKVAVVTAATEGIGYAIAKRLAEDGAKVMLSSRKQKNVDSAVQKLKSSNLDVSGMVCHVGKTEDRKKLVEQTVKEFGGIDILVSNAAANPVFGPLFDTTTEEAWDKIFDINVKSAFFLCKDAVKEMEKRGGGSIVLVSSIAGYVPFELIPAYSVSKTALLGLVKAMAPQCAQKNIRVNGLAPGIIKTKFSQALWQSDETLQLTEGQTMMKRLGTPEDCANVASFLVSDDAAYMTAETVLVSGGMTSRL